MVRNIFYKSRTAKIDGNSQTTVSRKLRNSWVYQGIKLCTVRLCLIFQSIIRKKTEIFSFIFFSLPNNNGGVSKT